MRNRRWRAVSCCSPVRSRSRLTEPIDGAVLLFQGGSAAAAEEFAKADPYVLNGLVTRWHVRKWPTVVGQGAATPLSSADF